MTDSDKILVDNMKETLRQLQSYLVWGIGSSLSFLILSVTDLKSGTVNVPLPGSFVSVNTTFAAAIALSIYWVVGALASYAHERAQRIASKMQDNPELLGATLTFPSIATEFYPAVRVLAAIIPCAFTLVGLIYGWRKAEGNLEWRIFSTFLLLAPYVTLVMQMTYLSLMHKTKIGIK